MGWFSDSTDDLVRQKAKQEKLLEALRVKKAMYEQKDKMRAEIAKQREEIRQIKVMERKNSPVGRFVFGAAEALKQVAKNPQVRSGTNSFGKNSVNVANMLAGGAPKPRRSKRQPQGWSLY